MKCVSAFRTASPTGREWFPSTPPVLPAYLANIDEFGNLPFNLEPSSISPRLVPPPISEDGAVRSWTPIQFLSKRHDRVGFGPTYGGNALQYYGHRLGKWAVSRRIPRGAPPPG